MKMSEKPRKIRRSDLRRQAQAMIRDGSMPTLETLLQAVAGVREKYAQQIKASRKQGGTLSKKTCGEGEQRAQAQEKADGLGPNPIQ